MPTQPGAFSTKKSNPYRPTHHSPQKLINEIGLRGTEPQGGVDCSSSRFVFQLRRLHHHPTPEQPVHSGHRDVEARRLGLREQRRVGSLSPLSSSRSSAGRILCSLTRVCLVLQDLRGHRRRRLLCSRGRHPPLGRIQHPHARPLQDLRPVSPLTRLRASICPPGL